MKTEPKVILHKLFDLQVCIPADWTDEQVKKFADVNVPCGTDLGWYVMKNGHKYLGGDLERVECEKHIGFVHMRLEA